MRAMCITHNRLPRMSNIRSRSHQLHTVYDMLDSVQLMLHLKIVKLALVRTSCVLVDEYHGCKKPLGLVLIIRLLENVTIGALHYLLLRNRAAMFP